MSNKVLTKRHNSLWDKNKNPRVSIITSVYNRKEILKRAINSIEKQTYKNIEYILVNNGSSEDIDDVVEPYFRTLGIPFLYIVKEYGGPHEGRNCGIIEARGDFIIILDSDDQYVPNAVERFLYAWDRIPENLKPDYREIVALCKNQYDEIVGKKFPDGINSVKDSKKAYKICKGLNGEHTSMSVTKYLKENLFPCPEGVSYVTEDVVWRKLEKYRGFFINEALRIYYTDTSDSISTKGRNFKTVQYCINNFWSSKYFLMNWDEYKLDAITRFNHAMVYSLMKQVLKRLNEFPSYTWATEELHGFYNRTVLSLLYLPMKLYSYLYVKKKCIGKKQTGE